MEDKGSCSSDCDSDFEANIRLLSSKRRHTLLSTSDSSDSSIHARHKRNRALSTSESDSTGSESSSETNVEESDSSESSDGRLEVEFGTDHISSDSEDSAPPRFVIRRNHRATVALLSDDSDQSSRADESTRASRISASVYPPPASTQELSDSGDELADKCAICLRGISKQEVGCPECCDHMFCLTCLVEWAKKSNKCPLDRQQFSIILVRENKQGQVVRQLPVNEPAPLIDVEDFIYCWVCGGTDRDDELLLCDGCDRGFHLDCLQPPLLAVPQVEEWFCPNCSEAAAGERRAEGSSFADAAEDEEGGVADVEMNQPDNGRRRAQRAANPTTATRTRRTPLARTRQSSRIWSAVHRSIITLLDQHEDTVVRAHSAVHRSLRHLLDQPEEAFAGAGLQRPSTSGVNRSQASTSRTTEPKPKKKVKRKRATAGRKTVKKRRKKTRRKVTTIKKKVKVENEDGTFTEEVIEIQRKAVRRKKKGRKKVVKKKRKTRRRRTQPTTPAPRTVRGRLARTLGMVAPANPRQLLPEVVRARRHEAVRSGGNLSRAMAGIPTLHIFGPRDELAPVSSGSEDNDVGEGGLGLLARRRTGISFRRAERSKAIELLRTAPASTRIPRPTLQQDRESGVVDLLGSILECQTIWHSKNSNVTIRNDGSVELPNPKIPDVRNAKAERVTTQAPIHSTPGSKPPPYRPYSSALSDATPHIQDNSPPPSGSSQRFGAPRNDREGYASFFNTMPPGGPTPFQRGGPPLRFRMPVRPQLRRIPLHPRPRPSWHQDEDDDDSGEARSGEHNEADVINDDHNSNVQRGNEDDVDLYSDIETNNAEKDDEGSDGEADPSSVYPALGPPPEPPAFLLSMGIEEDKTSEDVYDPAEPCDSDEEMVIDEAHGQKDGSVRSLVPPPSPPPMPSTPPREDDEECPIFSIYSSASMEFSRQNEEERARAFSSRNPIADNKGEDVHDKSNKKQTEKTSSPRRSAGVRLSFNVDASPNVEDSQDSSMPSPPSDPKDLAPSSPEFDEQNELDITTGDKNVGSSVASDLALSGPEPRSPSYSISPSSSPILSSQKTCRKSDVELADADSEPGDKERASKPDGSSTAIISGLEGLDVEEVSSEMEDDDFNENCSISSLSLSGLSTQSRPKSPITSRKKRKKRQRLKSKSDKFGSEEGEIESEKGKKQTEKTSEKTARDGNNSDSDKKKKKKKRSKSRSLERNSLENKENKKSNKEDLSWKKPSKKDKNYREGRKGSKERDRSREKRSLSPKKDKKKGKERKKTEKEKKKELERYDVRKVVKNKVVRKTDAFGRDLPSQSLSLSRSNSRSHSRSPARVRNIRRNSRSLSRSPSRGFRHGRSPGRRRFRSPSRTPSPRRNKKKPKNPERKARSRSRGPRRSWSRRRSLSRSPRGVRPKKQPRRKSFSRSLSLSPPPRSPSPVRIRHSNSPHAVRRSISPVRTRRSRSWSRPKSPGHTRGTSLEKLTVVITSKDKKKKKKKKEEKRTKPSDIILKRRKAGSSKEVFASGDNVLVSVNFSRTNKSGNTPPLVSLSPVREVTKKKKRSGDEPDRVAKKSKSAATVSKTVVDAALATGTGKRKKLTRLNEKEAEVILSRKPVAVIDLDMSPYREQTPSPVNVVVVSDSGSGDEGKVPTPPRAATQEGTIPTSQLATTAVTYLTLSSGPKTPPEPSVKFSINKPQQLRPISNPLGEDDDAADEDIESGDKERRAEMDTEAAMEVLHKGPNTPPEPRGPSTPQSPPSPQTSPDAYDPFEPTKSRSPSPAADEASVDKESAPEPEETSAVVVCDADKVTPSDVTDVNREEVVKEGLDVAEGTVSGDTAGYQLLAQELSYAVTQAKPVPSLIKKAVPPLIAPIAVANMPIFSLPSPNKTPNKQQTTGALQVSGIQRLQHRLGSPVNKTPNSMKSTPEKRVTEPFSTSNYQAVNSLKRNGDGKPRPPLQDSTNETIDMDDSPYSPGSSEGDDLFDPPVELSTTPVKPTKSLPSVIPYKPTPKVVPAGKVSKFDALFGSSPLKNGNKKQPKPIKPAVKSSTKVSKKASKKGISMKMDEDQLRILDELPSSAVELQVKDKFLKKLNRQERVVDEVKTVLKPHYARKHISKEEYKDILRRAVPKICHSKSGEINPSKIQGLVEAYVRKYRHAKKKTPAAAQKPKFKKSNMFS